MAEVGTFYQSQYTGEQLDNILKNVYDAVPLDGSKPMTAPLEIKEVENGYTQLEKNHTQTTDLGTALRDVSKGGGVVALLLKAADQAARLQFGTSVYDLIHSGNIQPYVKPFADAAEAASEEAAAALAGVRDAINNIPEGAATPIVNDLTTGGTSMALSAEMGKKLKSELDALTPEDIGAAPAGYGLGDSSVYGDWNYATKNGFYHGKENSPDGSIWLGFVMNLEHNSNVVQIVYRYKNGDFVCYARYRREGVWATWEPYANFVNALSTAGGMLTGDLHVYGGANGVSYYADRDYNGNKYSANLGVFPEGNPYLGMRKDGVLQSYIILEADKLRFNSETAGIYSTVLHTGNKPSGSYTGNGDATERTIEIGGIGDTLQITFGGYVSYVNYYGAIVMNGVDKTLTVLGAEAVVYKYGNLTLKTTNPALNYSGGTMRYQLL